MRIHATSLQLEVGGVKGTEIALFCGECCAGLRKGGKLTPRRMAPAGPEVVSIDPEGVARVYCAKGHTIAELDLAHPVDGIGAIYDACAAKEEGEK